MLNLETGWLNEKAAEAYFRSCGGDSLNTMRSANPGGGEGAETLRVDAPCGRGPAQRRRGHDQPTVPAAQLQRARQTEY